MAGREEMDFFRGGHVKIRGKRQKLTVAVSLPDDSCEVPKVCVWKGGIRSVPPQKSTTTKEGECMTSVCCGHRFE